MIVTKKLAFCLSNLVNISLLIIPDFVFIRSGMMYFKTEFGKRYIVMTVAVVKNELQIPLPDLDDL